MNTTERELLAQCKLGLEIGLGAIAQLASKESLQSSANIDAAMAEKAQKVRNTRSLLLVTTATRAT